MAYDTDVMVIGAGPVGLTLANEVMRHGASCRIVEKAQGVREVSKAMILHVRTQEALDKVGVAERAVREAQPLTEVVVHAYGEPIGSWSLEGIDSPYPHPLILGQNRTQHALIDLLASRGGGVEWGVEAVGFQQDADGVTTTLRAQGTQPDRTVRSRYLVGAEGSNSLVRKSLGLTFEGERYAGEQFIQADCRLKWSLPKGRSYLFLTADGYLMAIEFPDDVVRIFISLPDSNAAGAAAAAAQAGALEALDEQPTLAEIAGHLTRLTGYACELSDPIWLARYRTSHRYADCFSKGRAFVAGDAAHVHVPIGGQGMNTGIQDAFNLGWKLAGVATGALRETVLESYDAERHAVAASLIRGTDLAYRGVLHPSEARQRAARWFGPYLIRNTLVRGFMRDTLEELNIAYPRSPLNLDLGGGRGPKPGERVLDAVMVRASDRATVTLNALTRSPAFTLLIFSGLGAGAPAPERDAFAEIMDRRFGRRLVSYFVEVDPHPRAVAAPERLLIDALHEAHGVYGVQAPGFYLLRPDTYVAARGPLSGAAALAAHLERIFN